MKRKLANILLVLVLFLSSSHSAVAQSGTPPSRPLPASLAGLKIPSPLTSSNAPQLSKLQSGLMASQGPRQVVVRMAEPPVAEVFANGMDLLFQRTQLSRVQSQQQSLINQALSLDPNVKVLGSAQRALNAVMLEMDTADLGALSADPAVVSINPIIDYQIVLSETVPYIGGTSVHGMGYTGKGVRVAVLDSGIDYLHAEFGGSGDPAEHAANDPTTIEPGSFPTAKIIGGYDFVGERWAGGLFSPPLDPDPDPLDKGTGAGHGTHVADIIAGRLGVAPDAELYAVKVCSSVSSACSGVALIEAMDFALDPDGDGSVQDHVDIINMSLGSVYGTAFDDDLSQAVALATRAGVLVVTAAGNGQDKPFIVDTPSAAPTALSVAQTQVPSATLNLIEIVSPAEIAGQFPAVYQVWSPPLSEVIEAPVQYGDGAGGNLDGCQPFAPDSLAGKIVLVDRGSCNFTLKISNISQGGGLAGVIGLIAPGEPFPGSDGGDRPITVPGFMIHQSTSELIKSQLAAGVTARFDPAAVVSLIMQMTGTSSRGPAMRSDIIKPEIGAPGGSVSAVAGSGTGMGAFGGTSGATPMVAGSAALLKQAYPDRNPLEIKAVLVNTAETNILNVPDILGGGLAPITRIGGGEVRVDRAATSAAAAWDSENRSPALSFGFRDIPRALVEKKREVTVHNYSSEPVTYAISPSYRFGDDADNGAVQLSVSPAEVTVEPNSDAHFEVTLTVDGTKLREWGLNSGPQGASGNTLTVFEYDGYINLDNVGTPDDDSTPLHLPWQVLPRQAGNVRAESTSVDLTGEVSGVPAGTLDLFNRGVGTARIDAYSLIGTSDDLPQAGKGEGAPVIDLRYAGVATFPVPAGFCSENESFVMSFAVNTWERQTHANAPGAFEFDLDTNRDGEFDYAVINFDLGLPTLSDGRNATWVQDLTTGETTAMFFTDHGTNSGNTVLTFCAEQIGMNAGNFGQQMDVSVLAIDFYYSRLVTDLIDGITIAPLGERYLGSVEDIPPGQTGTLTVLDFGPEGTNPSETGLLLLLDASREGGVRGGAPAHNEAITITVNPR